MLRIETMTDTNIKTQLNIETQGLVPVSKWRMVDHKVVDEITALVGKTLLLAGMAMVAVSLVANMIGAKSWTAGSIGTEFVGNDVLGFITDWMLAIFSACLDLGKACLPIMLGAIIAHKQFRQKIVTSAIAIISWALLATFSIVMMTTTVAGILGTQNDRAVSESNEMMATNTRLETNQAIVAQFADNPPRPINAIVAEKDGLLGTEPLNTAGRLSGRTNQQWIKSAGGCGANATDPNYYSRTACSAISALEVELANAEIFWPANEAVQLSADNVTSLSTTSVSSIDGLQAIGNTIGVDGKIVEERAAIFIPIIIEVMSALFLVFGKICMVLSVSTEKRREYYTKYEPVAPPKKKRRAPRKKKAVTVAPDADEDENIIKGPFGDNVPAFMS